MKFRYYDSEGDEVEVDFPVKMEVCHNCEGYGTQLAASMKGHVYTAEEFAESFDEEEAAEYFRRGGRYDVTCEVCNGKNVVPAIDEERADKTNLAAYNSYMEKKAQWDYEDRMTYIVESGMREW